MFNYCVYFDYFAYKEGALKEMGKIVGFHRSASSLKGYSDEQIGKIVIAARILSTDEELGKEDKELVEYVNQKIKPLVMPEGMRVYEIWGTKGPESIRP